MKLGVSLGGGKSFEAGMVMGSDDCCGAGGGISKLPGAGKPLLEGTAPEDGSDVPSFGARRVVGTGISYCVEEGSLSGEGKENGSDDCSAGGGIMKFSLSFFVSRFRASSTGESTRGTGTEVCGIVDDCSGGGSSEGGGIDQGSSI